jgi:hypothetical protein
MTAAKNDNKATAKKRTKQAVYDEVVDGKYKEAMKDMLSAAPAVLRQNYALTVVRKNIAAIDEMSKRGASLTAIYNKLNNAAAVGVTANTFVQYVRQVRQETGSVMYRSREERLGRVVAAKTAAVVDGVNDAVADAVPGGKTLDCPTTNCGGEVGLYERTKAAGDGDRLRIWWCEKCGICFVDSDGSIGTSMGPFKLKDDFRRV